MQKGIAATTHVDAHGDKLSKNQLVKMANEINEREYAKGAGLAHDLLSLPIGKTIKGVVVPINSGEYALEIQQELFENYEVIKLRDGKRYVKAESKSDSRPFDEENSVDDLKLSIYVDRMNFTEDAYQTFWGQFSDDEIIKRALIRKSVLPDPEIVIALIRGTIFTLSALVAKKTLDKLSDSISSDIDKSYQLIKKAIYEFINHVKHNNNPITYVFEDNYKDIFVQLIVRSENADIILNSISKEKIYTVAQKIDELMEQFQISKIQLLYDADNENWEFRYLTTNTGAVIGTKATFRYTKELLSKQQLANRLDIKIVPRINNEL